MDETRLVAAHMLGQMGQKSDDVMLGDGLDLVDAGHVELHIFGLPDGLRIFTRDHAEIGHGVAGMCLDLEPDAEFGLRRPYFDHVGTGISGDHFTARFRELSGRWGRLRLRGKGSQGLQHKRMR